MHGPDFSEVLDQIVEKDTRYQKDAYFFLREALDYTQKTISKSNKNIVRHVTGQELLSGIRDYGLSLYGPMTLAVFNEWGLTCCEDFGELVFNLIEFGLLSKKPSDTREDFKGGFDFLKTLRDPFLPSRKRHADTPSSSNS